MHRPPAPSPLASPTAWDGSPPPPIRQVCSFKLPRMGKLRLPATRTLAGPESEVRAWNERTSSPCPAPCLLVRRNRRARLACSSVALTPRHQGGYPLVLPPGALGPTLRSYPASDMRLLRTIDGRHRSTQRIVGHQVTVWRWLPGTAPDRDVIAPTAITSDIKHQTVGAIPDRFPAPRPLRPFDSGQRRCRAPLLRSPASPIRS